METFEIVLHNFYLSHSVYTRIANHADTMYHPRRFYGFDVQESMMHAMINAQDMAGDRVVVVKYIVDISVLEE